MTSDEPEGYLLEIDGGPPRKPRPLYDPEIVNALLGIVDAGARLMDTNVTSKDGYKRRDALWADLIQARELVNTEIARRRRAQKEARG